MFALANFHTEMINSKTKDPLAIFLVLCVAYCSSFSVFFISFLFCSKCQPFVKRKGKKKSLCYSFVEAKRYKVYLVTVVLLH